MYRRSALLPLWAINFDENILTAFDKQKEINKKKSTCFTKLFILLITTIKQNIYQLISANVLRPLLNC